jgi:tyrosine-protein kinase Etk/Wzc
MDSNHLNIIEEQPVDLRRWLFIFFRQWPLFLTGLLVALTGAFLFISFSVPQYKLSVQILISNEKNPLDKGLFFTAFGNDPYQLENEKGILQSKSVTRKAISQLDFYTSYFVKGRFHSKELYKQSPFIIVKDTSQLQPIGVNFNVRFINDSLLYVSAEKEEVLLYDYSSGEYRQSLPEFHFQDTIKFGEITGNSFCRFTILPDFNYLTQNALVKYYFFRFYSQQELTSSHRNFKIENDRSSSILNISVQDRNPSKAADFLNKLTKEYLNRGIERDNRIAEATIRFIDIQLIGIVDSLQLSGSRLRDFKSSNKVLALDFQAEKVYTKIEGLEAEKAKLLVKNRYFKYLLDNLKSKSDISDLIAPTSLDINDPVINNLIMELAGLYTERTELSFNSIKDNPYLSSLERKINDARSKLAEAAKNVLNANEIANEELDNQIVSSEQILNRLPKDQQQLMNIERRFKLNDELYTYLLTRRSDMEIFKASNLPKNEVLDNAEAEDAKLVSPNIRNSLMVAIALGLILPGAFVYLVETINNKIRNRDDIQKLTDFPVVGQIIDTKVFKFPATLNQPNSELTESYRTLRTNLQFIIDESVSNVIMVTSAIKGEGKSFTALNLSAVYSFYGKKTILVDFDLRKSRTKEDLGIQIEKGLSNYLSKNASYEQVIYSGKDLNFDLICAGPVPPNPSELASSSLNNELFTRLKKEYDIVIIDTPPVGIVSDALLIYQYADISLLVTRFNYTSTDAFKTIIEDIQGRGIKKICIVLNDMIIPRNRYGYGYGYGYISTNKKKSIFKRG